MANASSCGRRPWWNWPFLTGVLVAGLMLGCDRPRLAVMVYPRVAKVGQEVLFPDFFQEWYSARCWWEGRSVYGSLRPAAQRFLGVGHDPADNMLEVNAHPPSAILLVLPFGLMDFPTAFAVWNALSLLALVVSAAILYRGLRPRLPTWAMPPLLAAAVSSYPFVNQMVNGQWNLLLLLLITASWFADRAGRPWLAGSLIGVAASIKWFPAYLLLYFVLAGRRNAALAGTITVLTVAGLTAAILGPDAFTVYCRDVLPIPGWYSGVWTNYSLTGHWRRLFDPEELWKDVRMEPVLRSRPIAVALTGISAVALTAVVGWLARREKATGVRDGSLAAAVVAMLLISPVTWDHYCLLLLMPATYLWTKSTGYPRRVLLLGALLVLAASPTNLARGGLALFRSERDVTTHVWTSPPWVSATALSMHTYALLALFALLCGAAPGAADGRASVPRMTWRGGGGKRSSHTLAPEGASKERSR